MEANHNATHRAVLQQPALSNYALPDHLHPSFRNLITNPGPDPTTEAVTKYTLQLQFYCFIQACGKEFVEDKLRSGDEDISQDEINSYVDGLWEIVVKDFRAEILDSFESYAASKVEGGDGDWTGGIVELFGRMSVE